MKKYRAAIINPWYTPYRVPVLREVALRSEFEITVIYCTPIEPGRGWLLPTDLPFRTIYINSKCLVSYKHKYLFGERSKINIPSDIISILNCIRPHIIVELEFRLDAIIAFMYSVVHRCGYVTWSDMTHTFDSRMGKIRFLVRRFLLSHSKALIASSSATKSHFHLNHSYPEDSTFTSMLGSHVDELISSTGIAPRTAAQVRESDDVHFLYVGSLIPLKGVDLLISAFARFRNRWPNAKLTIVGEGRERPAMEQLAMLSGCSGSVHFKGHVPLHLIPNEMIRHDVFVFPTKLDAFGLVVAEAVACGLPVICSCFAGAADDLVKTNGFIIDPHDIDAFVYALDCMMSAGVRRQMTEASRNVLPILNLDSAANSFCAALRAGISQT